MTRRLNFRGCLGVVELDRVPCQRPGCTDPSCSVVIMAPCHPSAGFRVSYVRRSQSMALVCAVCRAFVCEVQVGEAVPATVGDA